MVFGTVLVIALASVAVVYANWRSNLQPASSPVTSSVTSYPLELRMELSKARYQKGEFIMPDASLKNVSNRTVQVESINGWFNFRIMDENGTVVYDWVRDAVIFSVPTTKILEAGEEFNYPSGPTSIFKTEIAGNRVLELPTGNYEIVLLSKPLKIDYLEPFESLGVTTIVRTPPISVTITQI
jgi:hypothetical protein